MFDTLFTLVTRILDHPIAEGPIPDPSMLVDDNAYQLFHQFHRSLANLGRDTLRPMRARRLLQFIPGPPGLPGQYRMDPTAYFPPHTTDFLSTAPTTPPQSPARSHRHSRFSPSSFYTTPPSARERSRSRDRHSHLQPHADVAQPATVDRSELDPARDSHLSNHGATSFS